MPICGIIEYLFVIWEGILKGIAFIINIGKMPINPRESTKIVEVVNCSSKRVILKIDDLLCFKFIFKLFSYFRVRVRSSC